MKIKKVLSFFIVCISILFILKYIIVHSNFDALIVMSVKLSLYTEHFFVFIQNNVTKDVITIALTALAGNLTIFAFAYPYIYKSLDSIGKISEILLERVRENFWIKWYWLFLLILFIFSICFLLSYFFTKRFSPWFSIITLILLFIHICYVMMLYEIIKKTSSTPLAFLKFKKYKKIKDEKVFKDDINLLRDLFLFYLNTGIGESKITEYTDNFINIILILCKDLNKFIKENNIKILFIPANRIVFLNKRAVDTNHEEVFHDIDVFFKEIIEYCTSKEKKQENNIDNICFFYNEILYRFKYVLLYRIEKKIFDKNSIKSLWLIIRYSFENVDYNIKLKNDIYTLPFSLICELIDLDYRESIITEIITIINEAYIGKYLYDWDKYRMVMSLHIIILSYMLFRNKYDLFYTYMNFEESIESVNSMNRPQIPNTIYSIFSCFLGHNTVFENTPIFSKNISSLKYKFFTLFVLLMNSKNYADNILVKINKISHDKIYYAYYKKELESHSTFSENIVNNLHWNEILATKLTSFNEYKKYFIEFKQNKNLIEKIEFENKHDVFVEKILDKVINVLDEKKNAIFKTPIDILIKKEFSSFTQKNTKAKNIEEYINAILYYVLKHNMPELLLEYSSDIDKVRLENLGNSSVEFDKKSFLNTIVNDYGEIIFDKIFRENIFETIISSLYKKCKIVNSISEISKEDFSKYIMVTNLLRKDDFINTLFFKYEDIIFDKDVNIISGIKINDQKIKVSMLSYYFKSEIPTIILLDKSKFNIVKNQNIKIKFEDIEDNKIKISYENLFKIETTEEPIGYMLLNKKDKE